MKNTENRVTFKIKRGYYLERLTSETIKLLGSTNSKINADENGKNFRHLEITEVVLVHCNVVDIVMLSTMIIIVIQESFMHLFQINHLVNY